MEISFGHVVLYGGYFDDLYCIILPDVLDAIVWLIKNLLVELNVYPYLNKLSAGASGLVIGGVAGIVRSSTPGLFAIASGLQCAALGTTYYGKQLQAPCGTSNGSLV